MRRHHVVFSAALAASVLVACGAGSKGDDGELALDGSNNGHPDGSSSDTGGGNDFDADFGDVSFQIDSATPDIGAEAFFVNDPPPATCGPDAGVTPPVPGGTPECPDDKNLQGCPCEPGVKAGDTAPCWPGYRKNRNRGVCHDGTTTCVKQGETDLVWGACDGYTLPDGTTGKDACTCFSGGQWALANTSPCFISDSSGKVVDAVSTYLDSSGKMQCAADSSGKFTPGSPAWTTTTLKTDCAGHFKLCYSLKAGDAANPLATDCTMMQTCTEGDYTTPNVVQPFGSLPAWETTDLACAQKFANGPAYGEMSVVGTSVECDQVQKVFQRFSYCPLACNDPNVNPKPAVCSSCTTGGSGGF